MENNLSKLGWDQDVHKTPENEFWNFIERKNTYLNVSSAIVKQEFNLMQLSFSGSNIELIELSKAITRSFLRYDNIGIQLSKNILKRLKINYGLGAQINYATMPYPIIHFPNDTSEIGPSHKDSYDYINHFITTWTPLNNNKNKPIAIIEKSHIKSPIVVRKLRQQFSFFNNFYLKKQHVIHPAPQLQEYLLWYGETQHEGLLNLSDEYTVAMVIRFTSTPILLERTLNTTKLEKIESIDVPINEEELTRKFITIFRKIKDKNVKLLGKDANSISSLVHDVNTEICSWNLTEMELKRLSFIFALWAQRLEFKQDVTLFYLFSFFSYAESFYSLNKIIIYFIKNFSVIETNKFIEQIIDKYPYSQTFYVIEQAIIKSGNNKIILDRKSNKNVFLEWQV